MKYIFLKILVILLFAGTVFAGATLFYFTASSASDNIKLEWKSQNESNLAKYVIQRRTPSSNSFIDIATIKPAGSNSYYSYIDESAYKTQDLLFIYRLEIVDLNGSVSHSSEITVSHSLSGVKRTWGSIKAMFR